MSKAPTIVIAGAGVVGLATAARLATGPCADRLRVVVLEARQPPRWRPEELDLRVYALSRASEQLLDEVGAWPSIRERRASPYRRMRVWEGDDAFAPSALEFDCADIGEPNLGHIVEDSLLRAALGEVLAAAPSAELVLGATIEAIDTGADGVAVRLADGGVIHGTVVLAADGSDSTVRRLAELPTIGGSYDQTAVVTHVASALSHRETAWQRFLPGGPLAFLPLADGRSSIVWSLPATEAERWLAAPESEFLRELERASAGVLGALDACAARTGFPLRALHAPRYAVARVALLGDAAHTVHPLAGQGMNLGLLDAAAIASVVEQALLAGEDPGDLKVLGRYERQRKGENLAMLAAFDGLNRLFRLPEWAAPLRAMGLRAVAAAPPIKHLLMRQALGRSAGRENRLRWPPSESQA